MKRVLATVIAIAMLLAACKATPADPSQTVNGNVHARSELQLDGTFNSLMEGLLDDGGENACISPLSYKLALAMAYNGAVGETKTLLSSLFSSAVPREFNYEMETLLAKMKPYDGNQPNSHSLKNADLRVANSYWVRKGEEKEISADFKDALKTTFNAESGSFDKSPDPINKWVKKATNEKIDKIVNSIPDDAIMYLVNALYFNAEWKNEFYTERTLKADFTNRDGTTSQVDMMNGHADAYIDAPDYKGMVKSLNSGFEFTAIMSDKPVTLGTMIAARAKADSDYTAIKLALPKFDFDTTVEFAEGKHPEYDALFAVHGMDGAMKPGSKHAEYGVQISRIIHKTTFTCAEIGIEASAATVVELTAGAAAPPPPKEAEIKFDKPFTFMVTDANGEVLFYGRVNTLGNN